MNRRKLFFASVLFVGLAFMACQEVTDPNTKNNMDNIKAVHKSDTNKRVLRHMVIFKFNETSSEQDIDRLNKSFAALADSISVIQDFEWGLNDSPEDFDQDFTHCYLVTFASEADRDSIYTPHPQHQAFVASLQPHLEKVFVVDYWTNP